MREVDKRSDCEFIYQISSNYDKRSGRKMRNIHVNEITQTKHNRLKHNEKQIMSNIDIHIGLVSLKDYSIDGDQIQDKVW